MVEASITVILLCVGILIVSDIAEYLDDKCKKYTLEVDEWRKLCEWFRKQEKRDAD